MAVSVAEAFADPEPDCVEPTLVDEDALADGLWSDAYEGLAPSVHLG